MMVALLPRCLLAVFCSGTAHGFRLIILCTKVPARICVCVCVWGGGGGGGNWKAMLLVLS